MMLEILHTHLLYLCLVLMVLTFEQALTDYVTCEHSCRVNSTIMCLQFYGNKTDFHGARKRCKIHYQSTVLSKRTYNGNSTCFIKYLHGLGTSSSSAWLYTEDSPADTDIAVAFNITGTFRAHGELDLHSVMCVTQGSTESSHRSTYTTSDTNRIELNTQGHSSNNKSTTGSGDTTTLGKNRSYENNLPDSDNLKTSIASHWDVAIPVTLATASFFLSICGIICTVCGLRALRK